MSWCKLHTDILADAKLLRAARKGARALVVLPWLMAWAKEHDATDCGRLVVGGAPAEPEDIAAALPAVTAKQVAACQREAEAIGVLVRDDDGALRFAAWDGRSGKASAKPSDHPDAIRERVQRHRANRRHATRDDPAGDTAEEVTPDGNATETPVTRCVTPQNKSKSEKESESESESESETSLSFRPGETVTRPAAVVPAARARETTKSMEIGGALARQVARVAGPFSEIAERTAQKAERIQARRNGTTNGTHGGEA